MKTVTLYTEEEFKERWPEYSSLTVRIRKKCQWFDSDEQLLILLPGWVNAPFNFNEDKPDPGSLEYLKQQLLDIPPAIAHIEAHPEE